VKKVRNRITRGAGRGSQCYEAERGGGSLAARKLLVGRSTEGGGGKKHNPEKEGKNENEELLPSPIIAVTGPIVTRVGSKARFSCKAKMGYTTKTP